MAWLTDLGIIKGYELTSAGKIWYDSLPTIHNSFKDISQSWLYQTYFKSLSLLQKLNYQLVSKESGNMIGALLLYYYNHFQEDNAMRIPLYPSFLYVCNRLLCEYKIIANFADLEVIVDKLVVENRKFLIYKTARENESYINLQWV
jgi:hypothetical protein